jgi:hypothetical protein
MTEKNLNAEGSMEAEMSEGLGAEKGERSPGGLVIARANIHDHW